MSSEFKKYITSYRIGWLIATVIISLLAVASTISCLIRKADLVPALVLCVIAILTLIPYFVSLNSLNKIKEEEDIYAAEADFRNAYSMMNDTIRFGERWIFCKHSGRLLRYEEITQVYQFIHKTNFIEDSRAVKYVDINGKHRVLCNLALRGKSDEDVKTIITIIYSKNPRIKIGYR